jgi:hypothetical protein
MQLTRAFLAAALAVSVTACGPTSELERVPNPGPLQGPFYVSSEFAPSGHMGDGQNPGHVTAEISENCKERPANAGGDCYRFFYTPGQELWAGVFWVYPANNWGTRPGRTLVGPYTRVRFYAAAEPRPDSSDPTGASGLSAQFIAGGIRELGPFRDRFQARSDSALRLTPNWQQVTLDISGQDTSSVIGAFAWVTNYPPNSDPAAQVPTVIYIDDIVWE